MLIEKSCLICGKKFNSKPSANRKFCSPKCNLFNLHNKVNKGSIRKTPIIRICSICKNEFTLKHSTDKQKYCSVKCNGIATGDRCRKTDYPTSKCVKCGTVFEVKRKDSSGRYCSRKCSDATNKNQPAKWFKKNCEVCGKTYKIKSESTIKRRKTCSRKCANELKKVFGKEHPLYTRIDMPCELCGKIKAVVPAKVHEFRFCSRRCLGTFMAKNQPRISSIELLMKSEFDRAKLKYEQQFVIDYFITDFAFPENKLVVECDGIYWHNLPKQKVKDKRKDGYLKHKGWRVLRLGETEINENSENCLAKVIAGLQNL